MLSKAQEIVNSILTALDGQGVWNEQEVADILYEISEIYDEVSYILDNIIEQIHDEIEDEEDEIESIITLCKTGK